MSYADSIFQKSLGYINSRQIVKPTVIFEKYHKYKYNINNVLVIEP